MTADRTVTIVIQMKADQVEGTRKMAQIVARFPMLVHAHIEWLGQLLPDAGPEVTKALGNFAEDTAMVGQAVEILKPFAEAAVISDPDGRKERLQ